MQQAVTTRQDLNDGTEFKDLEHGTVVDLADLDFGGEVGDALLGAAGGLGIDGGDGDGTVVLDVDGGAGFFRDGTDGGTALADHVTDPLGVDLHLVHARSEVRQLGAGSRDGFLHLAQDVHAGLAGLGQRHLHDLAGDALDLDVHLQRGDTLLGTGHLEVHVAQVIFVAQDVGEDGELVAFLDQAHGDTGHVPLDGHAGVHQRQAAAADRSHRRRAVGLGDLGDQADGVGKVFLRGHQRGDGALGQAAVADFAALGRADAAGLAGGVRRHVVLHHEALTVFTGDCVDDLLVTGGTQRGHHQRLSFTAGEQRAAVGTRQDAGADGDGAHGAGVAAVDAGLAGQDLVAHDAGLQLEQDVADLGGSRGILFGSQLGLHVGLDLLDALGALLLDAQLVGVAHGVAGQAVHTLDERGVLLGGGPFPLGLATGLDQLLDGLDDGLHLLVAKDHGAQHHVLGELGGLGFDHQHGLVGTCHDQIQLGFLQLRGRGVEHVLAVDVADAGSADGAVERHAGDGQGSRGTDHGGDVGIDLGVAGQHRQHHLDFIHEAFGEQRTDGAVDQAGGEGFLLGGATLALEETAGNAACGVELLEIVDRQRKEGLTRLGFAGSHDGGQHHRVIDGDQDRTAGLAGDFPGFQGDRVVAPLKCFLGDLEHRFFLALVVPTPRANPAARFALAFRKTECPRGGGHPVVASADYLRRPSRSMSER